MTRDPFLDATSPLVPVDAVAAILLTGDGRYLLQLRDPKPEIFYPDHWGLFGGGLEPGEDEPAALARELREELGLDMDPASARYFTRSDFDFGFAGRPRCARTCYEVRLPSDAPPLVLGEGRRVQAFTGREALGQLRLCPYDAFVLWMHVQQARLRPNLPRGA